MLQWSASRPSTVIPSINTVQSENYHVIFSVVPILFRDYIVSSMFPQEQLDSILYQILFDSCISLRQLYRYGTVLFRTAATATLLFSTIFTQQPYNILLPESSITRNKCLIIPPNWFEMHTNSRSLYELHEFALRLRFCPNPNS